MIDKILAFFLLLIFAPILIIVSILILIEDGSPIIFKQKRVGHKNIYFELYKFRSMKKYTPNIATHLLENPSQYLLIVGRFIRKFSLDELPNLFNIIKGEMVFVGPRPALFNQQDLINLRYLEGVSNLKPGITGWAQINGRDEISIMEKVKLDKEYLQKKSFFFDLKIFLKTFVIVINQSNIKH